MERNILFAIFRKALIVKIEFKMYKPSIKLISELKEIAEEKKCKIIFSKRENDDDGSADYTIKNKTICIYLKNIHGRCHFINAFFHELGHHHCAVNNLWVSFHFFNKNLKYTWLKAEKWVDKWASKEMKKYYPKVNYFYLYSDIESIEWARNYYKRIKI